MSSHRILRTGPGRYWQIWSRAFRRTQKFLRGNKCLCLTYVVQIWAHKWGSSFSTQEVLKTAWIQPVLIFLLKLPTKASTHANWANVNFMLLSYAHACSWSAFFQGRFVASVTLKCPSEIHLWDLELQENSLPNSVQTWALLSHGNRGMHHLPTLQWQWMLYGTDYFQLL